MPVRYTRELLEEAARETANFDDAVSWCGGTPTPGSRRYLRAKMAEAGIATSHFTTASVRRTGEGLRAPVACSTSAAKVVCRPSIGSTERRTAQRGQALAELRPGDKRSASQPEAPTHHATHTWGESRV